MAISDTRPQARPEDTRGTFERMSDDVRMGFTAPFSDQQTRVDAMRDKGFTDTEISRHMAATANTIRENERLAELESRRDGGGSSFRDKMGGASGSLGDDEDYTYNPNNAAAQYRQTLMNRFGAMPMQSGFVQPAPMPMQPSAPGPVPPQMAPYTNPSASPGPTSPAFLYAAQNYDRLGGMQRMMPRPPEMMSVAERQQFYPDMYAPMPAPPVAPAAAPEPEPTADPYSILGRIAPFLQRYGGIAGLKSGF